MIMTRRLQTLEPCTPRTIRVSSSRLGPNSKAREATRHSEPATDIQLAFLLDTHGQLEREPAQAPTRSWSPFLLYSATNISSVPFRGAPVTMVELYLVKN